MPRHLFNLCLAFDLIVDLSLGEFCSSLFLDFVGMATRPHVGPPAKLQVPSLKYMVFSSRHQM